MAIVSALSLMALSCSSWSEMSPYWSKARADTVKQKEKERGRNRKGERRWHHRIIPDILVLQVWEWGMF